MKHTRKLLSLALIAAAVCSLSVSAHAADYSFTTEAPADYYGSTSYEDVYGSQYNYGGPNVVDYQIPELEYEGVTYCYLFVGMSGTINPYA